MKMVIPFGQNTPDRPATVSQTVIANDCLPVVDGFALFRSWANVASPLTARCRGALLSTAVSGTSYIYAGDATKLYESISDYATVSFTDESKGGGYSTGTNESWDFCAFDRNSKVIATNYSDAVQSMTIGAGGSSAFADMITSTNKPKARHVGVINNFVVLGNTNDATDGARPSRIWWSAFGDETDFDPDSATQCDYEDLSDGGAVQKIIPGNEYGIVVQRDCIRIMRYIGGAQVFEFSRITGAPGCQFAESVTSYGGLVFYIGDGPRFMMLDGVAPVQIGDERMNSQIPFGVDALGTDATFSTLMASYYDPRRQNAWFSMPVYDKNTGLWSTTPQKIYICHVPTRQWTTSSLGVEKFINFAYTTNKWRPSIFSTSHALQIQGLAHRTATVRTGIMSAQEGGRWQINSIRPLFEGSEFSMVANCQIGIASSDLPWGGVNQTIGTINSMGMVNIRKSGVYHQITCSISACVTASSSGSGYPPRAYTVMGLEIEYEREGER